MKTLHKGAWLLLLFAGLAGAHSGCTSTARRAAVVALGTGAAGAAGYQLSGHEPVAAVAGAVAGATLTQLALGSDLEVRQAGFDEGYVRRQSDAIKRQYFLRRAKEAEPLRKSAEGETVYYLLPGPEVTVDGRKLEPHRVAVRVIE